MDRNDNIMESLRSAVQDSTVTRNGMRCGIIDWPKLLYLSDGEEDDNLPTINAQGEIFGQREVQGPGVLVEPAFQPLEQLNLQPDQRSGDEVHSMMAQCDEGNPLLTDNEDMMGLNIPEKPSTPEWIEFLVKKGPVILEATPKNLAQTSRLLRKLGGEIQVLRPGNDAEEGLGDWRDRAQWRRQLEALAAELKTVDEGCSSEVRDEGVFVLTTFDYSALLEILAKEIERKMELRHDHAEFREPAQT